MKAKLWLMALGMSLVLMPAGWAQKPAARQAKRTQLTERPLCGDMTTQAEMNRCALDQYKKSDAELNKVYQQVMDKLSMEHMQKLKTAQLAWVQFRDAHCECKAFTYDGGSMQPLIKFTCLDSETRHRIQQLRSLAIDVSR